MRALGKAVMNEPEKSDVFSNSLSLSLIASFVFFCLSLYYINYSRARIRKSLDPNSF